MSKTTIKIRKRAKTGDLVYKYAPLHNMYKETADGTRIVSDFDTDKLQYSSHNSVNIECQDSYDGSVNLILNDGNDTPRIINTAFRVQEKETYEQITRNQSYVTNYYNEKYIDGDTRLQRSTISTAGFVTINLDKIVDSGNLKGGNYVFLLRYCDSDGNLSNFMAESGIISIIKGDTPANTTGTLQDEIVNKSLVLKISNIDSTYSHIKLYYKRSFCDLTGTKQEEYKELSEPFKIQTNDNNEYIITISGYEHMIDITYDSLLVQYNIYNKVKTQTQVQNMLFFANVEERVDDQVSLQKLSYYIKVRAVQSNDTIFYTSPTYTGSNGTHSTTKGLYNTLGYMPGEMYRIGVVYIYNDDTTSAVYNLRGCKFELNGDKSNWNTDDTYTKKRSNNLDIDVSELFISQGQNLQNTKGVFVMPEINNEFVDRVLPISLEFDFSAEDLQQELSTLGIKGLYFVRQRRIPMFIAQSLSIGISDNAYIPMLKKDNTTDYFSYGIIDDKGNLFSTEITTTNAKSNGLLCQDAFLNFGVQSMLDGSKFYLKPVKKYNLITPNNNIWEATYAQSQTNDVIERELIYIPAETSIRSYKNYIFSSKAGSAEELQSLRNLDWSNSSKNEDKLVNENTVRSNYMAYIGVIGAELDANTVYNIYSTYCESEADYKREIQIRSVDKSEYTIISDKCLISANKLENVYRGDCFICTSSVKYQYNFLDYNTPLNTSIVKYATGLVSKNYAEVEWENLNVSDWNAVPIGAAVVYTHFSNFNLNLRIVDYTHVDERALFGDARAYYPIHKSIDSLSWKLPESKLLNEGLSATMNVIPHFEVDLVPHVKNYFGNRIAFSNVHQLGGFQNGFRIFQGLSYQDVDNSCGTITKLCTLGSNLFCVFEHGCGIIPVNEKALISTTTGQSIHMYGVGVLQSQVSFVSTDYGSTWQNSIVITADGIYGVDAWAKKIWKYNARGFTIISDQYVQKLLNEYLNFATKDNSTVAIKDIKTHYNKYKGDIIFTFYYFDKTLTLCYNERIGKFITRYSWTPLLSENIHNSFITVDRNPAYIQSLLDTPEEKCYLSLQTHLFNIADENIISFKFEHPIYTYYDSIHIDKVEYSTKDQILQIDHFNGINYTKYRNSQDDSIFDFTCLGWPDNNPQDKDSVSDYIKQFNNYVAFSSDDNDAYFKFTDTNINWVKIYVTITVAQQSYQQILSILPDNNSNRVVSKLYTHGNTNALSDGNDIKPTKWYDKQEPFEFEFVVNTPTGVQKIFNNLVIISNNVEPNSLEISLIGDAYNFNKENIFKSNCEPLVFKEGKFDLDQYNQNKINTEFTDTQYSQDFNVKLGEINYSATIDYDSILKQYYLKISDDCRNLINGRRIGNIEYKEDKWNLTLTPIYYKQKELKDDKIVESKINSTRIRDKWVKIRIKYTGEKLVVISAIQTLMTLSFA